MKVKKTKSGYVVPLVVSAGASGNRIMGEHDGRLKIAVSAPAENGKANKAICEFLADELDTSKSCVRIVSGHTSRNKEVLVERASKSALAAIIR